MDGEEAMSVSSNNESDCSSYQPSSSSDDDDEDDQATAHWEQIAASKDKWLKLLPHQLSSNDNWMQYFEKQLKNRKKHKRWSVE